MLALENAHTETEGTSYLGIHFLIGKRSTDCGSEHVFFIFF